MNTLTFPGNPTTSQRGRLAVGALIVALAAVLIYFALNAGASTTPAATEAPITPAQPSPAAEAPAFLSEDELIDQIASEYEEGKTVMNGPDGKPVGYILRDDFDTVEKADGIGVDRGFNVYDVETDKQVGYWYSGVGFVSLDDYGTGVDAAVLAADRYGDEYAELYEDNLRAIELAALGEDRTAEESEELQSILDKHNLELP